MQNICKSIYCFFTMGGTNPPSSGLEAQRIEDPISLLARLHLSYKRFTISSRVLTIGRVVCTIGLGVSAYFRTIPGVVLFGAALVICSPIKHAIERKRRQLQEAISNTVDTYKKPIESVQERLKDITKLTSDEQVWLFEFLSYDPNVLNNFKKFLEISQEVRETNQKSLSSPTSPIPLIQSPEYQRLLLAWVPMQDALVQWNDWLEKNKKKSGEKFTRVSTILNTLLEQAQMRNSQIHSDFWLLDGIIPDSMAQQETTYCRATNQKGEMAKSPDGCIERGNSLLRNGVSWDKIQKFDAGGVKQATRHIIFKSPMKQMEINVDLDLSPLGNLNENQTAAILYFMAKLDTKMEEPEVVNWTQEKIAVERPNLESHPFPSVLEKERDKLKEALSLSPEQETIFMDIAVKFTHRINYEMYSAMLNF